MRDRQIKLLDSLLKIPSPSGFEGNLAKKIRQELLTFMPRTRVTIDEHNNVIAKIPSNSKETIMIDAHLDEIGFIIANVDNRGIISLQYIGGGCNSILSARDLIILNDKKSINAVVNRLHAHLVNNESDENIENIYEAEVDIGIRKRNQVLKHVKIGDPVVYKPSFNQLVDDYYSGYGFDDKSGCFILMETLKELRKIKKKFPFNIIFTFSAQEETGAYRVKNLIRKYKPDLFIEADVTFATDYDNHEELERRAGRCELGKGLVLYKGVGMDRPTIQLLESTARNHKIKIQYQANQGQAGFNSDGIVELGYPTKAVVLGIPLRNMHTPVEIINVKDLNYGINLLKNFLVNPRLRSIIK